MDLKDSTLPSLLIILILLTPLRVTSTGGREPEAAEGEFLIGLRKADEALFSLLERSNLQVVRRIDEIGVILVRARNGSLVSEAVMALEQHPAVEYLEPNYLVGIPEQELGPSFTLEEGRTSVADQELNDPLFSSDPYTGRGQWNMRVIGMPDAWRLEGGSRAVIVAVVDTGVFYRHRELQSSYKAGGYDWVNDDADPDDDYGHGSWVAGIIAAETGNGYGVAGMARVSIIAEKVLNNRGTGTVADLASGITHAADLGADIINLSLGLYSYSETLKRAVDYAYGRGCLLVAAAGNMGTSQPHYPAAFENVIAVASTYGEPDDVRAPYSNYGSWIALSAPGGYDRNGDGVPQTGEYWIISTDNRQDSYRLGTGTSASTPHVSGLAALVKSHNPKATNLEIQRLMESTAQDKGAPGRDEYYGYGRIDSYRALREMAPKSVGGEGTAIQIQHWSGARRGGLILASTVTIAILAILVVKFRFKGENLKGESRDPIIGRLQDGP
jgi:thermitase